MQTIPAEFFPYLVADLIALLRAFQAGELPSSDKSMEEFARLRDEIGPAAFNKRVAEMIADLEQQCVPPEA